MVFQAFHSLVNYGMCSNACRASIDAIGRIIAAVIVDPLREFLSVLSARHITLGSRTVLVIGSHIAERRGDHGSGIDGIASSTFSLRFAGEVTVPQYR